MKGYQLKITIKGSKPPIWRRVVVPEQFTFCQLHQVIQEAFGWYDYHLHEFEFKKLGLLIRDPGEEDDLMAVSYTHLDVYKRQLHLRVILVSVLAGGVG